jgi:hypothetical protein
MPGIGALHSELLARFIPEWQRLSCPVRLTDAVAEVLTIEANGVIRVVWVPFGYIQEKARVVLVGITPGRYQAELALSAFGNALAKGLSLNDAFRQVETTASFSGPLRANLVAMLDHIGLERPLGLATCADLFRLGGDLVHFTSALFYPVFINGENYSGTPDLLRTQMLRYWVDTMLAEEARLLPNSLWIPMGPKPASALWHLAERGLIDPARILDGLPHPSGANAERIAFFLGRKARSALSPKTSPGGIELARDRLRDQVRTLSRLGASASNPGSCYVTGPNE